MERRVCRNPKTGQVIASNDIPGFHDLPASKLHEDWFPPFTLSQNLRLSNSLAAVHDVDRRHSFPQKPGSRQPRADVGKEIGCFSHNQVRFKERIWSELGQWRKPDRPLEKLHACGYSWGSFMWYEQVLIVPIWRIPGWEKKVRKSWMKFHERTEPHI